MSCKNGSDTLNSACRCKGDYTVCEPATLICSNYKDEASCKSNGIKNPSSQFPKGLNCCKWVSIWEKILPTIKIVGIILGGLILLAIVYKLITYRRNQ